VHGLKRAVLKDSAEKIFICIMMEIEPFPKDD
jgi:hypothetical protein